MTTLCCRGLSSTPFSTPSFTGRKKKKGDIAIEKKKGGKKVLREEKREVFLTGRT